VDLLVADPKATANNMDHLVEAMVGNEMMRLSRRAIALDALHDAKSIEQTVIAVG